jgi:hypothetical protein
MGANGSGLCVRVDNSELSTLIKDIRLIEKLQFGPYSSAHMTQNRCFQQCFSLLFYFAAFISDTLTTLPSV